MKRIERLPPVCILAGGRGTRLGAVARDVPKPMMRIAGRPFIEHQLELLRRHGARDVVICVGHRSELLRRGIGDGRRFGLRIVYSDDGPVPAGTAGAVLGALPRLGEVFMVLYGDTYLRVDYRDVARVHGECGLPVLMTVLRNAGRWDTSNAVFDGRRVTAYDKRRPPAGAAWIDYGLSVWSAKCFAGDVPADLSEHMTRLATLGCMAGYEARLRFYEIGTPKSLAETERFLLRRSR